MNSRHFLSSLLGIITCILTLMYLGMSFNNPEIIDPRDWKRKWIIFFAWFNLVVIGIVIIAAMIANLVSGGVSLLLFALPVMTNVLILNYLGMSFKEPESIDPQDWKRKWIVFFAWFNLVVIFSTLLVGNMAVLSSKIKIKSKSLRRTSPVRIEMQQMIPLRSIRRSRSLPRQMYI